MTYFLSRKIQEVNLKYCVILKDGGGLSNRILTYNADKKGGKGIQTFLNLPIVLFIKIFENNDF